MTFIVKPKYVALLLVAALVSVPTVAIAANENLEPAGASATMSNALPVLGAVTLYTAAPTISTQACPAGGVTSFSPTVESVTAVHLCAVVSDDNGHADVCANAVTKAFTVFTSADAALSDGTHDKTDVALTCSQESGTTAVVTGTFNMEFWRLPGTGASAYYARLTITDVASATDTSDGTFDWTALKAIDVTGTLAFGTLAAGADSSEITMQIQNVGNVAFSAVNIVGDGALTGAAKSQTVALSNLKYTLTATTAIASGTGLTTTAAATGVVLAVATTDTPTTDDVYMALAMPTGSAGWVPADAYSATVTFTAV